MAEQSGRDVVDQTLSGGEPSPSGVPASINDKRSAEGDVGEHRDIALNTKPPVPSNLRDSDELRDSRNTQTEEAGNGKNASGPTMVGSTNFRE